VREKRSSRPASSSSSRPRRDRRRRSEAVISFSDSTSREAASRTASAIGSDSCVRGSCTGPSSQARSFRELDFLERGITKFEAHQDLRILARRVVRERKHSTPSGGKCPTDPAMEVSPSVASVNMGTGDPSH
jgi:hypothetical protein